MSRIKILPESRALISRLDTVQDPAAKALLDKAVADAASVDGDKVLDQFEADAIKSVFESMVPDGAALDAAGAQAVSDAIATRIGELKAERVKSTEVLFTSEGQALERFRGKILGAMADTIKEAKGREVAVNMMVFSFTDKVMADAIVDMAEKNPNVTFRLLTDWSQLPTSGSRQPARLAELAEQKGLKNLQIKFKKDAPYVWDSRAGRPKYNHGSTQGLNHHKGFVTTIAGRPHKMAMGSFNWSVGAMKSNYENMMLLDRKDPDNRPILKGYDDEFQGFWNNDKAALGYRDAKREKNAIYKALYEANGQTYNARSDNKQDNVQPYHKQNSNAAFDINSFEDYDARELEAFVGKSVAGKIQRELREYGRFDTWTELLTRVPDVAKLDTWKREQLMENLDYGDGGLSINRATVAELDRAGLTPKQARAVVAFREKHGAFESLDELDDVKGIGAKTLERIRDVMNDDRVHAYYSAREPGAAAATTGWADAHDDATTHVVSEGAQAGDGTVGDHVPVNRADQEEMAANLAAPVIDMLRRTKPGETFRLAMYGLSTSSPEYKELERAVGRGIKLRVVIYNAYNQGAIDALKALQQQGFDVDLRVIKSRVMHEKFGVSGDDVFNGSANWSSSSITKHSEDRFLLRNEPELAQRFIEEFARLWEKGNAP